MQRTGIGLLPTTPRTGSELQPTKRRITTESPNAKRPTTPRTGSELPSATRPTMQRIGTKFALVKRPTAQRTGGGLPSVERPITSRIATGFSSGWRPATQRSGQAKPESNATVKAPAGSSDPLRQAPAAPRTRREMVPATLLHHPARHRQRTAKAAHKAWPNLRGLDLRKPVFRLSIWANTLPPSVTQRPFQSR
jgi:hypothetical protein